MPDFPPETSDVLTVASRLVGDDRRAFELDPDGPDAPEGLPDLSEVATEDELIASMKERGWRLTMIGGGAGAGDLRRFYFRRR